MTSWKEDIAMNFKLWEIVARDGRPNPELQKILTPVGAYNGRNERLIDAIQCIRNIWNRPITINSWFRPPAYDMKIKGVKETGSQHCWNKALDFTVEGVDPKIVQNKIIEQRSKDIILARIMGLGRYKTFTHIDVGSRDSFTVWHG